MKRILIAFLFLFIAGCGVGSETPIRQDDGVIFTEETIGTWILRNDKKDDSNDSYVHIGKKGDAGKGISVTWKGDGSIQVEEREFISAKIGKARYVSIKTKPDGGGKSYFLLFRYEILDGRTLRLFSANEAIMAGAIKEDLISKKAKPLDSFLSFSLNTSESQLREFVAQYGERVFVEDVLLLEKVK